MAKCNGCTGGSSPNSPKRKAGKSKRANKQSQPLVYNAFAHGSGKTEEL